VRGRHADEKQNLWRRVMIGNAERATLHHARCLRRGLPLNALLGVSR
jgi:hypothetical protein